MHIRALSLLSACVLPAGVSLATLTGAAAPRAAAVSDPVAFYGLIEEVVFKPSAENPSSVQLWGAFGVAQDRHGNYYRSPNWGYLAFHLPEDKGAQQAREQWTDLARIAGSGEIIGFGARYSQHNLPVHPSSVENAPTTVYDPSFGMRRVRNADYGPIRSLKALPKPLSPAPGSEMVCSNSKWATQKISLVTRNCMDESPDLRYVFEIERPGGDSWCSPPIPAGESETSWDLLLAPRPGEQITWRVHVMREGLEMAPVASASFKTIASKSSE